MSLRAALILGDGNESFSAAEFGAPGPLAPQTEEKTRELSSMDEGPAPISEDSGARNTTIEIGTANGEKKKKKKKKKKKTVDLPEPGTEQPADYYLEKDAAELEDDPLDPAKPLADRVEYAINKYRQKHTFTNQKKSMFDDYLRFGGIDVGQKAFQGRTTGGDNDDLGEEDFESAKVGPVVVEEDEDARVSFSEVARVYYGNRFVRSSKFIHLDDFRGSPEVIAGFLRYLRIRTVVPEYEEDLNEAIEIVNRARWELPECKILAQNLPGRFNKACGILFGGDLYEVFEKTWCTPEETAKYIGISREEVSRVVGSVLGDYKDVKAVKRFVCRTAEVVEIEGRAPGEMIEAEAAAKIKYANANKGKAAVANLAPTTENGDAAAAAADTEPTPIPAEPAPVPAEPAPVPAESTPIPAESTPAPAEPTPAPAEPTPALAEPTSTPAEPTSTPTEPTSTPAEPTSIPSELTPVPERNPEAANPGTPTARLSDGDDLVKVTLREWKSKIGPTEQEDPPLPQVTVLLEKSIVRHLLVGMVITSDFWNLNTGLWYMSLIAAVQPTFHDIDDCEEEDGEFE
ncbi:Argonaute siRNA chaperone complex subunit Arb1-domain-containing protein [Jimgerdemannia flammicorona]|uniref:Argonaute siRNA chaperone complex subunit Arb1-domain-containing protein n=1 Tax=Jimgerdemannia flammicorona TaxID=994334 RepID=A0A433Q428_9FUNG|nr:Argonaute siRNA chaperone complex subunit Arb1-domain-containing protein [Jimgerdemannia flammicorona]